MHLHPPLRRGPRALAAALVALLLLLAGIAVTAPRAAAAPVAITEGEGLRWGLKQSWRNYAGIGTWAGGVEHVGGADGYHWPFVSGTYDDATHVAELQFGGSVRWVAHEGALDVRLSDPRLVIDGDDARVVATAVSKSESTGELVDYGEIAIVSVAVREDALEVADGTTRWSGLTTALTADGREVFSGNYPTGTPMDPVSTAYSGPGGFPPPTADAFAAPGSLGFREAARVTADPARNAYGFHHDAANDVVHVPTSAAAGGLVALDPDTLEPVGTPLGANPSNALDNYPATAFDPAAGTVFDAMGGNVFAFTWDPDSQSYTQETLPDGFAAGVLHYDVHADRLLAATGSTVASWTRDGGGAWVKTAYTATGAITADARSGLAADVNGDVVLTTAHVRPTLLRFDDDAATVTGSALADDLSDPEALQELFNQPISIRPIADAEGGFQLTNYRGHVFEVRRDGDDELRLVGERLRLGLGTVLGAASDAEHGTFMALDFGLGQIGFVEDGRNVGALRLDGGLGAGVMSPLAAGAGADGALYVESAGTQLKFERTGYSPTVTEQPQDAVVPLATGVESGETTFTAAATGEGTATVDGTPTIQWQSRAGDNGRFRDLDGETGATLTLDAGPGDNGRQVRAVFANAAGTIGTSPATLTVHTAAAIGAEPSDVAVTVGQTAELKVMPIGNPAPEIQWQRLAGGFWVDADAESGDFDVDGGFLRVPNANVEMDGAQFRARLRNRITPGSDTWSTVFTRTATLRVSRAVSQPVTFGGGHVDWGFANRWRCYLVGNIARGAIVPGDGATQVPGTTATGPLCAGREAGSEVVRFQVRGGSYDPADGTLELRLGGSVRFWGHDHHVPGDRAPQLDTTFSNLRIVASGTTGTFYADAFGATMDRPEPTTHTDVALVRVELPAGGPVARDGGLGWSGLATTLTAAGAEVFGNYPAGEAFDPLALAPDFGEPQVDPEPQPEPPVVGMPGPSDPVPGPAPAPGPDPAPAPKPAPGTPKPAPAARFAVFKGVQAVDARGVARIARLSCARSGAACRVSTPKRVTVRIAGKRYRVIVLAPKRIAAGRTAPLRVRLPRAAARRLQGRRATVRLRVAVTAPGARATAQRIVVKLRGRPARG